MERTHEETFVIQAPDCDLYRRMRPDALFRSMQTCGENHALSLGFGYDEMMNRGLFFVLARIHVCFERPIYCGETVTQMTFPGTVSRFFCPRYHVFTAQDGTVLCRAAALWVMLNADERKVISPLKSAVTFPDTSDLAQPLDHPVRIPQVTGETFTSSRAPVYSEFDINRHVNNTKYVAWLCDALGLERLTGRFIRELTAGYEKEITSCDPLDLSLSMDGEAFGFTVRSTSAKHFAASGTLMEEGAHYE